MKTLIHSVTVIFAVIFSSSLILCTSNMGPSSSAALGPPSLDASPPGPETALTDCMTPLANMSHCVGYVKDGSKLTAPDPNCCPELAGLANNNPICLCQLLSNANLTNSNPFGVKIDLSRALKLPTVCRLIIPPVSDCANAGYPVPPVASEAPMDSGAESSGDSTSAHSRDGLASSPLTGGNKNGALTISSSFKSFFVGLAFSFLLTFF